MDARSHPAVGCKSSTFFIFTCVNSHEAPFFCFSLYLVFDSATTFLLLCVFSQRLWVFQLESICSYLSFVIHLVTFCGKAEFELLLRNEGRNQSSSGGVWNGIALTLFLIFDFKGKTQITFISAYLLYVSVSVSFPSSVSLPILVSTCFLRSAISVCQPAAVVEFIQHHQCLIGPVSSAAADNLKWDCCVTLLLCSLKTEGRKLRGGLG